MDDIGKIAAVGKTYQAGEFTRPGPLALRMHGIFVEQHGIPEADTGMFAPDVHQLLVAFQRLMLSQFDRRCGLLNRFSIGAQK
jgi:hypothetical protein